MGWLKDALLFVTWLHGLVARTVVWRGNRLRVHSGSRLVPFAHSDSDLELAESFPVFHDPVTSLASDLLA